MRFIKVLSFGKLMAPVNISDCRPRFFFAAAAAAVLGSAEGLEALSAGSGAPGASSGVFERELAKWKKGNSSSEQIFSHCEKPCLQIACSRAISCTAGFHQGGRCDGVTVNFRCSLRLSCCGRSFSRMDFISLILSMILLHWVTLRFASPTPDSVSCLFPSLFLSFSAFFHVSYSFEDLTAPSDWLITALQ